MTEDLITDYIIPLPEGTMSGGKPIDGLAPCPNHCGEVAAVRMNKNGEIGRFCDGKISLRYCNGRHWMGQFRDFPNRDKETALQRARELELAGDAREYVELFENAWGVTLSQETQDHESANTSETPDSKPEKPELSPETAGKPETGNSGNSAGEPETPAEQSDNSGVSGPTTEEIHNSLYGG
ncbi:hypothetical protein [Emcibacter nanhaiensis]|uniref:Uncharacterized protein n=1 Tax=Emcibacter nanhaiensis TaxID=1505037 RepID=A0A501PSH1_9PROT|nr:hypothetical protein [Emcibacter nanhaiensis]TPD63002.1 hypothetical protein FIV46_02680 [Emcibacter nanhaiensis]